jgi:signal transduction histidine kinase
MATRKQEETAKKLAEVLEERDRLYATVAHELSSPLNSTMHSIEVLKMSKQKDSKTDFIENISSTLVHLRESLTELLHWATRRRLKESSRIDSISDVEIRETIAMFLEPLKEKHMKLVLDLKKNQG